MLPAAAVLMVMNCGTKYFCSEHGNCVTEKQCLDYLLHPYALGLVCISSTPDTGSGLFQNEEGAYLCPTGKVTVFNASTVRCVDSTTECTGLFASENACADTYSNCLEYLKLLAYDENGEKLCLTSDECEDKGAIFTYGFSLCKSAVQCTLDGFYPYIIGDLK